MSERLRSYPVSNDAAPVRPAATSRLTVRAPEGTDSNRPGGNFGITAGLLLRRINALPSLSPAAARALLLVGNESASAREMVALIETDVSFGRRVVMAANAPGEREPFSD